MLHERRGVALLEAILALAIVGTLTVSGLGLAVSALRTERRAAQREIELAAAHRTLTAIALLTREDLDRRLGARTIGPWRVVVLRPERNLYRLSVADTLTPDREVLTTVVHRPGEVRDAPR